MSPDLLRDFDELIRRKGYANRSEAVRDLVRQALVAAEWADPDAEVVGTVTIVYEHHEHELSNVLADLQHQYYDHILSSTHIHLDAHNCLEVVIVRGRSADVRHIGDVLVSTRGVKHGQMVCTTTGRDLT